MDAPNCCAIKARMKQRNRSNEWNNNKRKEKLVLAGDVFAPRLLAMKLGSGFLCCAQITGCRCRLHLPIRLNITRF